MTVQDKNTSSSFFLCALILLVAGLAVYAQTFFYGFLFDDIQFIVLNPAIRALQSVPDFFDSGFPLNRIAAMFSFALNYKIYGLSPSAFHIWNFFIHMLAAFSVWYLADTLMRREGSVDAERRRWLSFFAAMIFCVHPAQTQAVSYITQRFASMSALFYILSVIGYVHGRTARAWGLKVLNFSLFLFSALIAVLSKEEAVTLPLMILLVEGVFFSGWKVLFSWKKVLAAAFFGIVFVLVFSVLFKKNIFLMFPCALPSESHDGDIFTTGTYLLTQTRVFAEFFRLFLWPFPQTFDYDIPVLSSFLDWRFLPSFLFLSGVVWASLYFRKRVPLASFGLLWVMAAFLANLVPRANAIWEHKFYLFSFGFILAFVALMERFVRPFKALMLVLAVFTMFCFATAILRNRVWKDDLVLWQDALRSSPGKARVHVNLGDAYFRRGMYPEAEGHYAQASVLAPENHKVQYCAAVFYFYTQQYDKAQVRLDQAIRLHPRGVDAWHLKARCLQNKGDYSGALAVYDQMLRDPRMPVASILAWRGSVFLSMKEDQKAKAEYILALKLSPRNPAALLGMGQVFMNQKDHARALIYFDRAVDLAPNNEHAYLARSMYYNTCKDVKKAWEDLKEAFRINPFDPDVNFYYKNFKF